MGTEGGESAQPELTSFRKGFVRQRRTRKGGLAGHFAPVTERLIRAKRSTFYMVSASCSRYPRKFTDELTQVLRNLMELLQDVPELSAREQVHLTRLHEGCTKVARSTATASSRRTLAATMIPTVLLAGSNRTVKRAPTWQFFCPLAFEDTATVKMLWPMSVSVKACTCQKHKQ